MAARDSSGSAAMSSVTEKSRRRMAPFGRNVRQRYQDEPAFRHARMRQSRRPFLHPAVVIDQVEIERAAARFFSRFACVRKRIQSRAEYPTIRPAWEHYQTRATTLTKEGQKDRARPASQRRPIWPRFPRRFSPTHPERPRSSPAGGPAGESRLAPSAITIMRSLFTCRVAPIR